MHNDEDRIARVAYHGGPPGVRDVVRNEDQRTTSRFRPLDARVEVPPELKHYSERHWFLAAQVAEVAKHNVPACQDYMDLAAMIQRGDLVTVPAVTESYILFGIGERANEEPFSRYEEDRSIELYNDSQLNDAYKQIEADIAAAQEMTADPDMREFAQEEIEAGKARLEQNALELQKLLLPRDPNDERNIFLEIRAGTGGDASALFAGDLFRMYVRYAERQRWAVELVSESPSELGGYKEVVARLAGQGVYSKMKFESGGHRVQRVPETEAKGRVHTSAATVAVLAEPDDVEINLKPEDYRLDKFCASGPGGQHVNKTESAVRITHAPTGIVVQCQSERSQHMNKAQAMRVLRSRLYEKAMREQEEKAAQFAKEKKAIEWGSQIRSYVLAPYRLVTDHRTDIKIGNVDAVLDGKIDEFITAFLLHQAGERERQAAPPRAQEESKAK